MEESIRDVTARLAETDDAERRAVLDDAIERVEVRRLGWGGNVHRKVAPERLLITWKLPDHTGPRPTEDDFRDGLLSSARVS